MPVEPDEDAAEILASTFHELREGVSSMGHRIDRPAAVMSTAEAVSVYYQTMLTAYYYGDSRMDMGCLSRTGGRSAEGERGRPGEAAGIFSDGCP